MGKMPLEGVRVCDLTWAVVGPIATQMLAVMGAEVIKIESNVHTEINRRGGPYANGKVDIETTANFHRSNMSKMSCTLDLRKPEATEIAKDIVRVSDIVVSNFRNGVMDRFGLGEDALREVKPDLILVSSTSMGNTGPYKDFVGYNEEAYAYGGLGYLTGYRDEPPRLIAGDYADYLTGTLEAFAMLSALHYRSKTGKSQTVEVSMAEAVGSHVPEAIMDYSMNQRIQGRIGNRMLGVALHNCFRCKGEDKWAAIAVANDEEWAAFCGAIGNPTWTEDEKFSDSASRLENQDELEVLVGEWTRERTPHEVAEVLQAAGVPCGPSVNIKELVEDPHLNERGYFVAPEHPEVGKMTLEGMPWKSSVSQPVFRHAPLLGQDNYYVFHDLLGKSDEEFARLVDQGIIN